MAVAALPARSCLTDGEAIACDETGLAVFDLLRGYRPHAGAIHCAFDLIELDGNDLRRSPIEARKEALAKLLRGAPSSIVLNEHYEADGAIIYKHACQLGCEGIVSKRRGSPYMSGRSPHWIKSRILPRQPSPAKRKKNGDDPKKPPVKSRRMASQPKLQQKLEHHGH